MTKSLNQLRDEAYANAVAHGFHDEKRSIGETVALLHSECSEVLEEYRDGHCATFVWYEEKLIFLQEEDDFGNILFAVRKRIEQNSAGTRKPCGIPMELADILIRVFDTAGELGIDLDAAVEEKMKFNAGRPMKHGGKKL